MNNIENIILRLTEYFGAKKGSVLAVYVFGSYVNNKQHKNSDLDLALLLKDNIDEDYFSDLQTLFKETAIDLKILNKESLFFQFQVIKTGRKIFCSDEKARVRYEARVMSEYQDFKPFIDYYNKCMHRHIKEGSYGHRL